MTKKLREIAEGSDVQRFIDLLYEAGWQAPNDAQHSKIKLLYSDYFHRIDKLAAALKVACDVIDLQSEALKEIGDGISPMGGYITPDGHRRIIAEKSLAAAEKMTAEFEKGEL